MAEIARLQIQRGNIVVDSAQAKPPELEQIDRKIKQYQDSLLLVQESQKDAPEIPIEQENPEFKATLEALSKRNSELLMATAVAGQVEKTHQEAAARLHHLRELEPSYVVLRDAVDRAAEDVKLADEAFAAAERKRVLKLGDFSTLKTIEDASLPLEKEGPNRGRLVLGGWIIGAFLGLAFVIMRALPDSVVRSTHDLEGVDGIAVIGMMPRLDGRNLRRHEAARERGW